MNNPLLSIVCLGYKHAQFLADNISSINMINYEPIEIIVVDDGSNDGSVELLEQLQQTSKCPMTIIAQENTGNVGKNFNNGLKRAKGELITFISLDDVFNPSVVAKQIASLNENKHLLFSASVKAVSINNNGYINNSVQPLSLYYKDNCSVNDLLELEYQEFGAFYIQGAIFRKALIDAIGGFDEDQTGDDIILRTKIFRYMLENNLSDFELIKENSVYYRMHDNNVHKNSARQIKIVTEYLQTYWANRDDPDTLIDWVTGCIRHLGYEKSLQMLEMNERSRALLNNPIVQRTLRKVKRKENSLLNYIYHKKKYDNRMREITLFGLFKFRYTSKGKRQDELSLKHWKDD